jgi:hypothetical protein
MIILKRILEKQDGDWIHLAQGRGQLRAFVNPVMNPEVPQIAGIS